MGLVQSRSQQDKWMNKAHCDDKYVDFDSYSGRHESSNQAQLLLETKEFNEQNPGCFEDLQRNIRELTPQAIDGVKIVMNVPAFESSQITANWMFNASGRSKFFPSFTYVGDKSIRANERSPILMAEVDGEGQIGLNYAHSFNKSLRFKLTSYSRGLASENLEACITYYGPTYSITNSILNPKFSNSSFVHVAQYLKRLNRNVDVGIELASQVNGIKPTFHLPSFALRVRHGVDFDYLTQPNNFLSNFDSIHKGVFMALLGSRMLHLSYSRNVYTGFQLLTTFDYQSDNPNGSNLTSFGYSYTLPKTNISVKSQIDSTFTIQTVIEKSFVEGDAGWSFFVSAAHNFPSNRTIAGLGLTIGR